jgi:all-trans-8'-apo-beta-carotenal 15,15'-oxygenase
MERLFFFDAVETSYDVTGIEGRIPEWIRGSYYINGPARFERGGRRYQHWLDGDGMVCALHFTENGVRFVSRFVQTRKLQDEAAAGAFLYRGFGTAFTGDRLRRNVMLESPVNINVSRWENRLLAFGEQSLPIELDPLTLETIGEFDFGGKLNEVSPFAAHAKLEPSSAHLLNFGISFSAQRPMLNVYEFDPAGAMLRRGRYPLELQHSNHDFGFSHRHAVFFLSPLIMDFARFLDDRISVMESLDWQPEKGSRIFVVPRHPHAEKTFSVPAGEGYCLHLLNCFEQGRELVVDILELESPVYPEYRPLPDLFQHAPGGTPVRYIVDLETQTLKDRQAMSYDCCSDFPAIDARLHGAAYDDFWLLGISASGKPGRKFFDHLAHGSWSGGGVDDVYHAPPGEYLAGEPVLIGHPTTREESVVLVQHLNPKTDQAAFLLFRAFAIHQGPVIRIPLKHRLHPLFHAGFYPATEP